MMENVTSHWAKAPLSDLISFVIGGDWGKAPEKDLGEDFTEAYCIRGSELRNWREEKGSSAALRLLKKSSLKKRELELGDILLEISGGGPDQPVGRTVIIDEDVLDQAPETPKVCTNFFRLVRLSPELNKKYVNYYLEYFYHTGEVVNYQGGSNNLRNLKFKEYSNIQIPLAPLPEQKRIVSKLDALFGHLDVLREKMDRIPELLKNFRQQVLTQAVTGKLYHRIYPLRPLGEFDIKIQTGPFGSALHKSDYISNGIPVINPSHIGGGQIIPSTQVSVSPDKFEELQTWKLEEGDVVLGRRGEMGRAAKFEASQGKMLCGTGSIIMRKSKAVDPDFLSIYMRSPFTVSYLESNSVGSTMVNLNQKILKSLPFPDVSESDQSEIVQRVETLFSAADHIEAQYQSLKEKIDKLPQAILSKAFKGELVEQDENDEPAWVLLERIKAEKEGKVYRQEEGLGMVAEKGERYRRS